MYVDVAGRSAFEKKPTRRRTFWLIALWVSALWSPALIFAREAGRAVPAGVRDDRILVRWSASANPAAIQQLHATLGTRVLRTFPRAGGLQIVQLRAGLSSAQALAAIRQSGLVELVEPDYLLQALIRPNDYRYPDQWNMDNTGIYGGTPGADIMAEQGWDLQNDASSIIVAVIDTGVRYTHEDLAANMWVNPGETGLDALGRDKRTNGIDDDGNGYIDDVHGINVLNGSGNPMDDWGHGTHVAGIVGAVGNNTVGVAGVAWRVKIMACKFITATAQYSVSDAITCLEYARTNGARIVTASWGGYAFTSQALHDEIALLRSQGIILAAAAGNDNNDNDTMPLYPASYDLDNIVAVAATDRTDTRASWSNYGALTVDLGAPGAPVFSTWNGSDSDYQYNDGTSMAAPHIAGACALLWTRFPADTHQQIIQRILSTVDPLPSLTGRTRSGGRLNLAAALGSSGTPPPSPPAAPSGLTATATSASDISLAWTDNSSSETGFEVQRSTDNATFVSIATTGANATSFTVSGLVASTTYYFRVRAVASGTTSAFSNVATATTLAPPPPPPPPTAPSGLTANATSASDISLAWTDNSSSETGFEVQRSTDNVNFASVGTTAANATSFSVGGLKASTTYYFRVRAVAGTTTSAFSNVATATTLAAKHGKSGK